MTPYQAPWWLPGGHVQTVYALLFAARRRVAYRRERWETPDGDFVDVDWLEHPSATNDARSTVEADSSPDALTPARKPLVVLFHGLEGSSESHYAHSVMDEAGMLGWRGVVVNFRGCGGAANRLPRAYHSGDSAELDWMLRRLKAEHGGPLYAVGISLGGNVLLKWLGEQGGAAAAVISRAAAVSAPIDLTAVGEALGRGFNLMYTHSFLWTLKRKSLAKLEHHPRLYDPARLRRARTLRAFDDLVTAPLHGFADAGDYWKRASSKPWLVNIEVLTLILNARNDPFMPEGALPLAREVSPCVTLEFPTEGGHVAFVSGPFPGNVSWLAQRLIGFFRQPVS